MALRVFAIDHQSPYLSQIMALGDSNRETLGLLPRAAYRESANKKWILVAIDEPSGLLAGYLLYHISRRKSLVYVVHLCVDSPYRRQGVARALFEHLRLLTVKGYRGIRIHCRVDYEAHKVWPKLGFTAINTIPGRSKTGNTTLGVWWFDFGHPTLFSFAEQQSQDTRTKVVIDANVFFQLQNPEEPKNAESCALLHPWLDIELCLTPEILNEIARNPNPAQQAAARHFAQTFKILEGTDTKFQDTAEALRRILPLSKRPSDDSDRRQLARAIVANIPYFVTRDGTLLGRSDAIYTEYGIQVVRPADIVLIQDELLHASTYNPARLAGSKITLERVHGQESGAIIEAFLMSQYETKDHFGKHIQRLLAKPDAYEAVIARDQDQNLALIVLGKEQAGQLTIPVFRLSATQIASSIAQGLLGYIATRSVDAGRSAILIQDRLSEILQAAVQNAGYFPCGDQWGKICLQGVFSSEELSVLLSADSWSKQLHPLVSRLIASLGDEQTRPTESQLLAIERALWPVKISDVRLPAFIIPIKPEWAMHLFDVDTASQDLFGGEPRLMLSFENAYYRSSSPKILEAPARVLWYVSSGSNRYEGSRSLKACSYLDEVEIGHAKTLFTKYKRLGIYKWSDVYNGIARSDPHRNIMVFTFSGTELFSSPVPLVELRRLWGTDGKEFTPVTPIRIQQDRFVALYKSGIQGTPYGIDRAFDVNPSAAR